MQNSFVSYHEATFVIFSVVFELILNMNSIKLKKANCSLTEVANIGVCDVSFSKECFFLVLNMQIYHTEM